ncbi:MAG: phosphatase PAP2 family protein [Clostridiales bacterium]|nr:phosphatase PAP2 family protein [Clostridiales bacterium]
MKGFVVKWIHALQPYRHFLALLTLVPVLLWFQCLEAFIVPKYTVGIALDQKIPFIPWFVIPYVVWFLFIAFGLCYTGLRSKENFYKLVIFLGGAMSIAYLLYTLFPNQQALRPHITENGLLSAWVKWVYTVDTPTNVCPSVHVLNAFAVSAALLHTKEFARSKARTLFVAVYFVLVCLSTIFIKQHSVVDVICGLLIGLLFYIPLYRIKYPAPEWRKAFQR